MRLCSAAALKCGSGLLVGGAGTVAEGELDVLVRALEPGLHPQHVQVRVDALEQPRGRSLLFSRLVKQLRTKTRTFQKWLPPLRRIVFGCISADLLDLQASAVIRYLQKKRTRLHVSEIRNSVWKLPAWHARGHLG